MTPKKKKILTFSIGGSVLFLAAGIGAYFITDVRVEQKSPLTEEQKEFNKLVYKMSNMKSVDGTATILIGNTAITGTPKVSIKDHKLEMNLSAQVQYDENTTIPFSYDIYQEKHYVAIDDTKLKFTVEEVSNILQYFKDAGIDLSFLDKISKKLEEFDMTRFMDGLSLKKENSEYTFSSKNIKGINICCDNNYNLSKIGILNFITNGVIINGYFQCDTNHDKEITITCPETKENPYTPITDYDKGIKRVTEMLGNAKGNDLINSVKNWFTIKEANVKGPLYFEGFGQDRFKLMESNINVSNDNVSGSLYNIPIIDGIIEGVSDQNGIREFKFTFNNDNVTLERITKYDDEQYNEDEIQEITMEQFLEEPFHYILKFGIGLNSYIITAIEQLQYKGTLKSFLENDLKNLTFDEENKEWTIVLDTSSMMGSSLMNDTNIYLSKKDKDYISNIHGDTGMTISQLLSLYANIDFDLTVTKIN